MAYNFYNTLANNSIYGAFNNMDELRALSFSGSVEHDVFQRESEIQNSQLQNELNYKIATAQRESLKKRINEDIKKSFSYFA